MVEMIPWLIAMALLIGLSAFFSGAEAALFYLRWSDRRQLAEGNRAQRAAERLLRDPDRLLSSVLFWNLCVNMAYFAILSAAGSRLTDRGTGPAGVLAFTIGAIIAIIFLSELLPKSLAVLAARTTAALVGIPLSLAIRLVDPVMPALRVVNLLSRRLIWPGLQQEAYLEVEDLTRAVELSHVDAQLAQQEKMVLQRVVELSEVHVDEWMRPRTQCRTYRPPVRLAHLRGNLPPGGYLLIAEPKHDEIVAALDLQQSSDMDPSHLEHRAQPVVYVPWCSTVSHAFEQMQQQETDVAAVVNEHGETIGVLTLRDIRDALLTDRRERGERLLHREPIQEVDEGVWYVSGMTNLSRLGRDFEVELPESRHVTISGVVQETLERLPQVGDQCQWGPFQLEVLRVDSDRNVLLRLTLADGEAQVS